MNSSVLPVTIKAQATVSISNGATVYTAGRPPWYNLDGERKDAFIIGIAGGSASGKTTVANYIIEKLNVPWVCLLSQDSFYKVLGKEDLIKAHANEYDFDHPDAFDLDLLADTLQKLKDGKHVQVPIYDFSTHSRSSQSITMYGANIIVFEGILAFANQTLRDLMDVKIFVDEDSDIRLARRMKRDINERGRELIGVLKQYNRFVKPNFELYIQPTMQFSDLVIPRGAENNAAMRLLLTHLQQQLSDRGFNFRKQLVLDGLHKGPIPQSCHVIKQTNQVKSMHTIIRNKDTAHSDFVFYAERLMKHLVEYTLSFLPFKDKIVATAGTLSYKGCHIDEKQLVGVSILRAGLTMETSLRAVIKDIPLGKILIQTNSITKEPELHYAKLPKHIHDGCYVLLMDATIATGAAAMMAIRVLLDHAVPEERILFQTLIASPPGLHALAYAFPKITIVTTAIDMELNEKFHLLPGVGNFGDRYFGTQ